MSLNEAPVYIRKYFICWFVLLLFFSCKPKIEQLYPSRAIEITPEFASNLANDISQQVSVTVDDNLKLSLWAADTLVTDPIAISVDETGRVFYTSAIRQTNSEFDIRRHKNWMAASISFKTVEDRREFLRSTFSETNEEGQQFLKDLNQDGILDWKDLTFEKEQIWFVEDSNGDGLANRTQLYLEDFHQEITDVANGLEAFNGEVFIAVGPDMWRTGDRDKDGIADIVNSISHGFAVHIGFGAHGMSGAKIGPDGRIWWGIGDIGMNVVDKEGKKWEYPNRGVVVRSELDGSGFEVYAAGVRNTHEFVFDKYGNLISVDNDGDHQGERERLVYLINGSDTGWRINWQFGKYTDPDNNTYKVWMDENMHVPHQSGQAAYFLPPIANYVNGPTGMVYNPGTALSDQWDEHFFVAEFRGTPVNSPLHAFTLKPKGASFELAATKEIVRGTLPTGVDFGPDGALYFSDWIDGWSPKGQGRIWKLDVADGSANPLRAEVSMLLAQDFSKLSVKDLPEHLAHPDMRVRQKAQFELANRGKQGYKVFEGTLASPNQMARIHSIWGIGMLARQQKMDYADGLIALLRDPDPEIITQAAKTLGDIRYSASAAEIVPLLDNPSLRVQLHAAEALGRMAHQPAFESIVSMLEVNEEQDVWLRHAGMVALSRLSDESQLTSLKDHPSSSVRIAAVVALRRMKSPKIAEYLEDENQQITTEAARGINDDLGIEQAFPALADLLTTTSFQNQALIRRAINANLRLGTNKNVDNIISYLGQPAAPAEMKAEALQTLSTWSKTSVFDRVDGRYLGSVSHDDTYLKQQLEQIMENLLTSEDPVVQQEAATAAGKLKQTSSEPQLVKLSTNHSNPKVRSAALEALFALESQHLTAALQAAFKDKDPEVRSAALAILPESNIAEDQAVTLCRQIMTGGTYREQQVALSALGNMKHPSAVQALDQYLGWLDSGKAIPEIQLDIIEAVIKQNNPEQVTRLNNYEASKPADDPVSPYLETLHGGDSQKGQDIFYTHESAQCVRCHTIFETGGTMGPGLSGVATEHTAMELLTALITPSASFEDGYHMVTLKMEDGETLTGVVQSETEESITIRSGSQEARTFNRAEITEQTSIPSSMPPMGQILTKKEIRDVLAFLGTLTGEH